MFLSKTKIEEVIRVMDKSPVVKKGEDGLLVPQYAVYNINAADRKIF